MPVSNKMRMMDVEETSKELTISNEENYRRSLISLHKSLREETIYNVELYKKSSSTSHSTDQLMYSAFCQLYEHLENIDGVLLDIFDLAPYYDFKDIKANGYRSLVQVTQSCLTHLMALVRHISINKSSYLFRATHYGRELESYTMALGTLRDVLRYTRKLMDYSPRGQLVPSEELLDTAVADEIQMEMDMIDQECFYGRTLGFQYAASCRRPFEVVHISLAAYSHTYQAENSRYVKLAGSLLASSQYLMNPEHRAEKVVEVTLSCNIDFCKAFWNLSETDLLHNLASFALPVNPVNHIFHIEPEDLTMETLSGGQVTVKAPSAHIGNQKLQLRIMSSSYRLGMDRLPDFPAQKLMAEPPSDHLIIQCHGGGFVSQTSRTHEAYLRHWARDLKVPILCIDYSLAPAAPFPRALEEVYYAYAWAITNKHLLGTTAKKIAVVGDSAGGNLLLATMLHAIQDNIRLPDGIVAVYTPTYIQFIPSPSRTLSIMDALLPVGILTTCLEAYAGDLIVPWKGTEKVGDDSESISKNNNITGKIHQNSNTAQTSALMHDDEDEEIQSFFLPRSVSVQSEDLEDTVFHAPTNKGETITNSQNHQEKTTTNKNSDKTATSDSISNIMDSNTDSMHSIELTDSTPSTPRRRGSHKRSGYMSHSRSESLPVTPKVPHFDPIRHDRVRHFAQSPLYKFAKIRIKQDPFMSPLHASDDLLCRMPSTYLVGAHLDPCLDDSVMFAKKLGSLGVDVHLDAVDGVPHGFLNFALVSSECMQATNVCKDRLKDCLGLEHTDRKKTN